MVDVPAVDATVAHSARVWNYWVGGKDNYAVDREVAEQVKAVYPEIVEVARASRAFLGRAVQLLAGEIGVRQFLDVGTGLPTANNTHEVAQQVAPDSRIVYVDNDPMVLAHARALLTSTPEGATAYIPADVHDPDAMLEQAADTLDFGKPIALTMLGILGHVEDYDEARSIAGRLTGALAPGSYFVLNDGTNVHTPQQRDQAAEVTKDGGVAYIPRSPAEIEGFFEGMELLSPGVVSTPLWRPAVQDMGKSPQAIDVYCGVGRKL